MKSSCKNVSKYFIVLLYSLYSKYFVTFATMQFICLFLELQNSTTKGKMIDYYLVTFPYFTDEEVATHKC